MLEIRRARKHSGAWGLFLATALVLPVPGFAAMPAFPGAEGYGRTAQGGRGGRIIAVTTLADGGPGSLRACLQAAGPRVCIFRVGGIIRFTSLRPVITNPFLTIAGETAPGDGILITHAGGPQAFTPLVIKNTHDVIVRDIRVRMDRRGTVRGSNSGITIENSSRVILDHVSTSWTLDENIGLQGQNDEISITNSVFGEGVMHHSKCALLASDPRAPQRLSFIGNLCISDDDRNPNINFRPGSCVEVVNNLLYNANVEFAEIWESNGGSPVSIVGNYFRAGPNTKTAAHALVRQTVGSNGRSQVFQSGNIFAGVTPMTANFSPLLVSAPPCPLTRPALSAHRAYSRVLRDAGAMPRDSVDRRFAAEVIARRGKIVWQPGQLPVIRSGTPYPDADHDGMSDTWERANGLDPNVNDTWEHSRGSAWTNLERFLSFAHQQRSRGRPVS